MSRSAGVARWRGWTQAIVTWPPLWLVAATLVIPATRSAWKIIAIVAVATVGAVAALALLGVLLYALVPPLRVFVHGASGEAVEQWFHVSCAEDAIRLHVTPPGRRAWDATIPWDTIERVCFVPEDPWTSDGIYVFVRGRANSYAIPMDAAGGDALWHELVRRGHFDASLAGKAMGATTGMVCWPPADRATR